MGDEIHEVADDEQTGTVQGTQIILRAYLTNDGSEHLVWKLNGNTGNGAILDAENSFVALPQGSEVSLNGSLTRRVKIPRWLCDSVMNDFETLHETTDVSKAVEEDEPDDETDEIEPMFDDMNVEE